jgi:hypothetical protein
VVLRSRLMLSRRAAIVFAIVDLSTGALLGSGVFFGLPDRWMVVDVPAAALMLLQLSAGGALLAGAPWAARLASAASLAALVGGLGLVTVLALTASWLSGVYGPVGRGGGIILALVALLALPYLVVLPAVQLFWLRLKDSAPQ